MEENYTSFEKQPLALLLSLSENEVTDHVATIAYHDPALSNSLSHEISQA